MSNHGRTRLLQWIALAMILGGPVAGIPCYLTQSQLHIPAGLPPLGCILLAIVGPGILVRVLAVIPFIIVTAAISYAKVPPSALATYPDNPDSGPVFEILLVCGAFVFAWLWAVVTNVVALIRSRKPQDPAGRHQRNGHGQADSSADRGSTGETSIQCQTAPPAIAPHRT